MKWPITIHSVSRVFQRYREMTGIMSLKPNPLRHTLSDFLLGSSKNGCLTKFIDDPQDTGNMRIPLAA